MKTRIAIWAVVGALVVILWTLYIAATFTHPMAAGGMGRALVCLTCPIALAGRHPQSIYLVLIVNAATYALAGFVVEIARRYGQNRSTSN
jgi:hypothetical protein